MSKIRKRENKMTWEIVVGIIALAGFVISIGKIVSNNTKAMTEISVTLDNMKIAFGKTQGTVNNHEVRIAVLEEKEKDL